MSIANASAPLLTRSSEEAEPAKETSIDDVIETYMGATGVLQLLKAVLVAFASAVTDACSPCALPPGSWAWDRPAAASVVSESKWALGFLLATLADSLPGRKMMLVASLASMSVAAALTALAPNVWAYAALRFVSGPGLQVDGGHVRAGPAHGARRQEPPRHGERGVLPLLRLPPGDRLRAPRRVVAGHVPVDVRALPLLLRLGRLPRPGVTAVAAGARIGSRTPSRRCGSSTERRRPASPWPCWTRRALSAAGARRRLAAIMGMVYFGMGMVYFGMPLNVGSLGSDLYLSVAYNALAEVSSAALVWVLISRADRRGATAGAVVAVARMAAEVLSFFASCAALDVVLVYATKLFPTSVRNSAVGLVRQAVVLGGASAPVLIALGGERGSFWSFGVFGIAIGCSGLFVTCLPETWGRACRTPWTRRRSARMPPSSRLAPRDLRYHR
ncbi:unnamed protein product [Urochloa decumbens]|uniref:Solute carrier family 40 protein n=1 Tax=Urochloa decumbens TaxID=240449 RepID=A0ABC9B0L5_9POAL